MGVDILDGRGLWGLSEESVPPWEWRRGGRREAMDPSGKALTCGSKSDRRERTTCEEARFHESECGLTRLDGDGAGVPAKPCAGCQAGSDVLTISQRC